MEIKNALVFAFVLAILFNVGWAGWSEEPTVRVLDQHNRPIANATVYIEWEVSQSKGDATTLIKKTNAAGRAEFMLTNVEYDNDSTDFDYIAYAEYGGETVSREFTAGKPSWPRTLHMPVYMVTFKVRDKSGKPLPIELEVDGKYTVDVGSSGYGYLQLAQGEHIVKPQYLDLDEAYGFEVGEDLALDLNIELYSLAVRVIDDKGVPLSAKINAGSQTKQSADGGWARFYNLTKTQNIIKASWGRYKKSVPVDLEVSNRTLIIFDSHPPIIKEVESKFEKDTLEVRAVIGDDGEYASGLSGEDAAVKLYYIGPDNMQNEIPMYSAGYNLFEGIIPIEEKIGTLRFTVQATDAQGNSASTSDTFVIPTAEPKSFEGTDSKPPASAVEEVFNIDLASIAVIVVIATIIIAGSYYYYSSKKAPSEVYRQKKSTKEYQYGEKEKLSASPSSAKSGKEKHAGKGKDGLSDTVPKKKKPPKPPSGKK